MHSLRSIVCPCYPHGGGRLRLVLRSPDVQRVAAGKGALASRPSLSFFPALSPCLRGKGQASPGHIRQLVLEVIRGDAREHTLYDIARYASGNDVIQGEVLIKVA